MNKSTELLVVDDHSEIRELLRRFLEQHGYRVQGVADGEAMRRYLRRHQPDLIILDLMLPGDDGLTLCRELRAQGNPVPVIMLTAMGDDTDRIVGLELGADDYLPKPFNPRELLARIKAVLRRQAGVFTAARTSDTPGRVRFGPWRLDLARRELLGQNGISTSLSTAEFDLLRAFVQHPNRVLSRDQLLDLARGREAQAFDRAIDTLVSRLRRKLESDSRHPQLIKTVWGGGYLLAAEVHHED